MNAGFLLSAAVILVLGATSAVRPFLGIVLLMGGLFLGDRGFAYIHFPAGPVPLFAAEAVLAGTFVHYAALFFRGKVDFSRVRLNFLFIAGLLFAMASSQSLLRGFAAQFPPAAVLRDSALAYYALFTLILAFESPSSRWIAFALRYLAVCIVLRTAYVFAGLFLPLPFLMAEAHNPAALSMYFALSLLMIFSLWPRLRLRPLWAAVGTAQACLIVIGLVRTTWVSLIAAYLVLLFLTRKTEGWRKTALHSLAILAGGVALSLLLLGLKVTRATDLDTVNREIQSFAKGRGSDNIQTRLWMWEDALNETVAEHGDSRSGKNGHPSPIVIRSFFPGNTPVLEKTLPAPAAAGAVKAPSGSKGSAAARKKARLKSARRSPQYVPLLEIKVSVFRLLNFFFSPYPLNTHPGFIVFPVEHAYLSPPEAAVAEDETDPGYLANYVLLVFLDPLSPSVKPFLGTPFGKEFRPPKLVDLMGVNRFDPHNSYIAVFYRMGLSGLLGFALIVGFLLAGGFRDASRGPRERLEQGLLTGAFAWSLYVLSHAAWDVTLENAFKGAFLWISFGIMLLMRKALASGGPDGAS